MPAPTGMQTGNRERITGLVPQRNSALALTPLTERQIQAANAARDLFDLLPPQDALKPELMMTAVVEILSRYHQDVIAQAPLAIAQRVNRLTLKAVTDVCDELLAPIIRKIERVKIEALPPPAKPDQATRDAEVAAWERIKPMLNGALRPIGPARVEKPADGNHYRRIASDLEARRARNGQLKQGASTGPPSE